MRFVDNRNITDPRLNLALEEFLLRHVTLDEPLFLLYVNEPSVIIGRNQNVLEEVDLDYAQANGVHVIRRISGGGAVYHDLGNLNFSFIDNSNTDLRNFTKFTGPIVQVLNSLGVPAEFRNTSDLFVGGKKISGNAQASSRGRMFSHGTILFDSYLPHLRQAIRPTKEGIESSAVQSNRSSVTNIRDFLHVDMTLDELKSALVRGVLGTDQTMTYPLYEADWAKIAEISEERYKQWTWNIGRSPRFTVTRTQSFPHGQVHMMLEVVKGCVAEIKFLLNDQIDVRLNQIASDLEGVRYDREALREALTAADFQNKFGDVELTQILSFLY